MNLKQWDATNDVLSASSVNTSDSSSLQTFFSDDNTGTSNTWWQQMQERAYGDVINSSGQFSNGGSRRGFVNDSACP